MNWIQELKGFEGWEASAVSLVVVLGAVLVGMAVNGIIFFLFRRWASRQAPVMGKILTRRCRSAFHFLLPLLFINVSKPLLHFPEDIQAILKQAFSLLLIGGVAWVAVAVIKAMQDLVFSRYNLQEADNLKARAVYTQVDVLVKIGLVLTFVIAVASMLMTFESVRQLGVSLLASAGLVGIIAGFAAQRSLATLMAGIQIAITQPIRLDDVVIVEGEWGRIEEITLTYVVVRIWDLRRLVVPITYFLEKPFQNWTRTSADLLGTVYLYTDYTVPVGAIRGELFRLLQQSDDWDGKVWGVQVTNASERAMEVRALMSAADSGKAWNLRCEMREKLLEFIQREYPQSLPLVRARLQQEGTEKPENRGKSEEG